MFLDALISTADSLIIPTKLSQKNSFTIWPVIWTLSGINYPTLFSLPSPAPPRTPPHHEVFHLQQRQLRYSIQANGRNKCPPLIPIFLRVPNHRPRSTNSVLGELKLQGGKRSNPERASIGRVSVFVIIIVLKSRTLSIHSFHVNHSLLPNKDENHLHYYMSPSCFIHHFWIFHIPYLSHPESSYIESCYPSTLLSC